MAERFEHVSVAARLQILRELKDALIPKVSRNDPAIATQKIHANGILL